MNTFNSLAFRRRRCLQIDTSKLKENFFIDINNKWLCLTGVALFWET